MSAKKRPQEAVSGSYTPIPHAVLDCKAFVGASDRAKAMLLELLRQHNGGNNGRLQLSVAWLKARGWTSTDQIQKAKIELLDRGLIFKTKQGGLNIGPDWFALTWLQISNFSNLDVKPNGYHPGHWRMLDAAPVARNCSGRAVRRNDEKRDDHSSTRNRPVPCEGTGEALTVPCGGTKTDILGDSTVPRHGNNECCQLPPTEKRSSVVGKKGRSGVRAVSERTPCN